MSVFEILLQKTGDQIFSIILLVVWAVISFKKQQKTDDRLTQYIAEDRKEMMGVIENNTKVMEQILNGGCASLSTKNPRARNRTTG